MTSIDLSKADALVEQGIEDAAFPGACYAVGTRDQVWIKSFGRHMYCPESKPIREDTIWDLASVSKVVGATSAAMLLHDAKALDLDSKVSSLIPDFGQEGKQDITVRNLLLHDSGLAAFRPFHQKYRSSLDVMMAIYREALEYPTGTKTVYSDLGIVTLGKLIEKITSTSLDDFVSENVFTRLGMKDTLYKPAAVRERCAPTEAVEEWRMKLREIRGVELPCTSCPHEDSRHYIQGEVHDPTAMVLGGVAGHAGLFSTAGDLAKFMRLMLNFGEWQGKRLFQAETVRLFTMRQSEKSSRGIGWDTPAPNSSAGTLFSKSSFGHTGYTGTSVWGDLERGIFSILLTNRVHPSAENTKLLPLRGKFQDEVARALTATRS
ncbi:MAG TPA: serine hydrolase domain-containing protein [Fimbriimonadaceae bacterium]|nr:serine hydrolase domain-containing protein [Fimbriimonadaceae bacterium]